MHSVETEGGAAEIAGEGERATGRTDLLYDTRILHDLLRTYSVEATIDPGAEILDRDQADFIFDAIFDHWWRDRLDEPRPADDPITVVARKDPTGAENSCATSPSRGGATECPPPVARSGCRRSPRFRRERSRVPPVVRSRRGTARRRSDIADLETLATHFERSFAAGLDFARLWDAAHPATLPLMRSRSFDLREYKRRSIWKRAKGDVEVDLSPTRQKSITRDVAKLTAR